MDILKSPVEVTGATILLVEDDSNDSLLMRLALERTHPGIRVSLVSSGIEARKYLQGQQPYADRSMFPFPQLIFLDLVMPVITGLQVLRWIREKPEFKSLPVIMFTSCVGEKDARLASEMGADACLIKPLGFEELEEEMSSAVELWLGRRMSEAAPDWVEDTRRKAA